MDDTDVIARSLGAPTAFEELFERHYDRFHRFCRSRRRRSRSDGAETSTCPAAAPHPGCSASL
ncbi:MAG TPA: hypothetical protein VGC78_10780 [Gaiellaceae bacterium]